MESFSQFLSFLQGVLIPKVNLTVLDGLLLIIFGVYAFEGYSIGFIRAFLDFCGFILSFAVGLKFYTLFGTFLNKNFTIPIGFSNAIGFFVISIIVEFILGRIGRNLSRKVGPDSTFGRLNRILGIFPSLFSAAVLLSFLLTIVISMPISPSLKHAISSSKIGSALVINTSNFEGTINNIFGQAVSESLNFFTVEPKSDAMIQLHFSTNEGSVDEVSEQYMLKLVNKERKTHGLSELLVDTLLTKIAREHAKDMFARGYFSHFTPEKLTPFDRMANANISFTEAGENLALSPNTDLAMKGLMESPGHRANILSLDYHKIGIGVIDGGIYGEMFVQDFTD